MREYAVEADPGKCTASFPTFDTFDAALAAASQPCMERKGLPLPRVLVRDADGWRPANLHDARPMRQCCACGVPVMIDGFTNVWVDERNQATCPAREGSLRGHLPG